MTKNREKNRKGLFSQISLVVLVILMITVTGCESLPFDFELPWEQNAIQLPGDLATQPAPEMTPTSQTESTEVLPLQPEKLIIWLPPDLDPHDDTEAGSLLMEKLNSYAYANKIEIVVRVKSQTGSGSLIDSLTATRAAVPEALPDLIVLSANDLQLASQRDLIYENEQLTEMLGGSDWYSFARQLSQVDGKVLSIPFAADPLAMIYSSTNLLPPSGEWNQIHKNYGIFGFAADDSLGRFLLLQYMSAGGDVMDGQGYTLLEEAPLIASLQALKDALNTRHINSLSLSYQNDSQVWQSFLDRNLDTAVVPVSLVLSHSYEDSNQPHAALSEPPFTLATGSAWALGSADIARQELALDLLEELMQTEFLAKWTEALHRLPSKPSALGSWTEPDLKPALEKIAGATVIYPPNAVLNQLGPILRNATLLILRDGGDVVETARQAIESVK